MSTEYQDYYDNESIKAVSTDKATLVWLDFREDMRLDYLQIIRQRLSKTLSISYTVGRRSPRAAFNMAVTGTMRKLKLYSPHFRPWRRSAMRRAVGNLAIIRSMDDRTPTCKVYMPVRLAKSKETAMSWLCTFRLKEMLTLEVDLSDFVEMYQILGRDSRLGTYTTVHLKMDQEETETVLTQLYRDAIECVGPGQVRRWIRRILMNYLDAIPFLPGASGLRERLYVVPDEHRKVLTELMGHFGGVRGLRVAVDDQLITSVLEQVDIQLAALRTKATYMLAKGVTEREGSTNLMDITKSLAKMEEKVKSYANWMSITEAALKPTMEAIAGIKEATDAMVTVSKGGAYHGLFD